MATATVTTKPSTTRLKELYRAEIVPQLRDELGLANVHQVPRLEKIVISAGLGRAKDEKRLLEVAANTLRKITGQQPIEAAAKKSIASFKLREGSKIGLKVTLRDDRMYEFADRFINLVLPRLRDFRGVSNRSFDKGGNYNIGLVDQSVFPELAYEDIATSHGLQITFVAKAEQPAHTRALLEKFGLPFEKSAQPARPGETEEKNG
jgi:large subunit ribosomal protein L5